MHYIIFAFFAWKPNGSEPKDSIAVQGLLVWMNHRRQFDELDLLRRRAVGICTYLHVHIWYLVKIENRQINNVTYTHTYIHMSA